MHAEVLKTWEKRHWPVSFRCINVIDILSILISWYINIIHVRKTLPMTALQETHKPKGCWWNSLIHSLMLGEGHICSILRSFICLRWVYWGLLYVLSATDLICGPGSKSTTCFSHIQLRAANISSCCITQRRFRFLDIIYLVSYCLRVTSSSPWS